MYTMKSLLVITALLSILQIRPNSSFSIQKRRSQSPSDLRNALQVLRRKRRRIDDVNLQSLYRDLSDQYLPYDDFLPYEVENGRLSNAIDDQLAYANLLDSYSKQDDLERNQKENLDKSGDTKSETINEIKEIFEEIDKNGDKKVVKSDKSVDKMSPEKMDQLLSEAVKVPSSEEKPQEQVDSMTNDSPKPVSTNELKDLFKETEVKQEEGPNNQEKVVEITKEIVQPNDENSMEKKKRMTKRDNSEQTRDETLLDLVQEVQELRGKVAQLQLIEYLEDKENDYLASALKSATLAQIRKGEPYLEEEYSEIQKALEIEEALQGLKDTEQIKGNPLIKPEYPTQEKRSQVPVSDNLGMWYDEPVQNQEDEAQRRLEDFVKQYRETYDVDSINDIENEDEPIEVVAPLQAEIPENEDICPQLDVLSSNCDVASLLEIDEEARDLCNRHEICYVCGATVGLSQQDCDGGFRSETVERCNGEKCIQSGAEFLWFIKQDHKYTNSYLEQCDAPCVKGYIVGG